MLKRHKKLLILLGILAVLIGIYLFVSTSQDPAISGKLYTVADGEQIGRVEIQNQYGAFVFDRAEEGWNVTADGRDYRTNPQKMELMIDSLEDFTVSRVLDEEIGLYGFEEPSATVTLTTGAGKTHRFAVGNVTVSSSEAYVKDLDSGVVAITSTANVAQLDGSLTAYRDKDAFTVDSGSLRQIGYYEDGELAVSVISDGTNWYLNYPFEAPARSVVMNEILTMLKGWTIAGFPDMENVTEEEMGITNGSQALMLVDAQGNTQVLQFGNESGTARFVRTGGEDDIAMLYTTDIDLSAMDVDALLFVAPLRTSIENIVSMTVQAEGGQEYVFEVNDAAQTASVNGRMIDYQDFVGIYYKYITLIADGRDEGGAQDMKSVASMTTVLQSGDTLTMQLLPRDADTYFMQAGGEAVYYMDRERLDSLMERISGIAGS